MFWPGNRLPKFGRRVARLARRLSEATWARSACEGNAARRDESVDEWQHISGTGHYARGLSNAQREYPQGTHVMHCPASEGGYRSSLGNGIARSALVILSKGLSSEFAVVSCQREAISRQRSANTQPIDVSDATRATRGLPAFRRRNNGSHEDTKAPSETPMRLSQFATVANLRFRIRPIGAGIFNVKISCFLYQ